MIAFMVSKLSSVSVLSKVEHHGDTYTIRENKKASNPNNLQIMSQLVNEQIKGFNYNGLTIS